MQQKKQDIQHLSVIIISVLLESEDAMKCKLTLIISFCLLITLFGCKGETEMHDKDHTQYYVTSKNGNFTISDFSKVQLGMSYYDVVNLMGEPTGTLGSGIIWDIYSLDDGSYVKLLFTGYEETLKKMIIVDTVGREFALRVYAD